jgi:exoribonuclease-2
MLDNNAMSQLKSLKQEIQKSIPRHEGKVRATSGRFGFVVTDKNQQFYLSPDEMEKVLPGDQVAFRVEPAGDKKEQAFIEKLIESEISEFCGRYIIKGKGHFIEADHPALNRWLFVPPKFRNQAKDGQLVKGHLTQHPYPHGKAQAAVDTLIGMPEQNGAEAAFMCAKWGISEDFSESAIEQLEGLKSAGLEAVLDNRQDHTSIPFVTIDSVHTKDLDDALYAEASDSGWTLWVAIADPASLIQENTPLDQDAAQRSTSVYFSNKVVPMLPAELSEHLCSLKEGEIRPALVAEIQIQPDGEATLAKLTQSIIKSRAKLSYQNVSDLFAGQDTDIPSNLAPGLQALNTLTQQLNGYRQSHCRIAEERPDYRLVLDEKGKVKEILRQDRNQAQKLVEECMLVFNRLIALWLADKNTGIFINQAGIRSERIGDVANLLKDALKLDKKPKFKDLETFLTLLKQAKASDTTEPVETIIGRQMDRSQLSLEPAPHMGLGFEVYTTASSPLRKYHDLVTHRMIHQALSDLDPVKFTDEAISELQDRQHKARMASNQTDTWMKLDWLKSQDKDRHYKAVIQNVAAAHFIVRLDDQGIDGLVDRRKASGKWTFDSKTLSHSKGDARFQVGQPVEVKVKEVDSSRRDVKLELIGH